MENNRKGRQKGEWSKERHKGHSPYKGGEKPFKRRPKKINIPKFTEEMRLNKFLAHAGVCSRREADVLIEAGTVEVNGKIVTELGFKVNPAVDKIKYGGHSLSMETKRYVLLNKPRGFITTTDDPLHRRTVMQLVNDACRERIVPVGRLDRNTTGLLLFTNDGDLAKKLTHPKFEFKKVYHAELNKPFQVSHFDELKEGITLDDGFIKPDDVKYVKNNMGGREVGIELHSGKNRIVRRMFEYFGYEVVKLDRVILAGLTKKDLPKGKWRMLTAMEVQNLKNI